MGNTLSATSARGTPGLDARSQRRVYERLAELEGRDAMQAGRELDAMAPEQRAAALSRAITAFQRGRGAQLIEQIRQDNALDVYDPDGPRLSPRDAPEAGYTQGGATPNDATMQAIVNSWPQTILGRSMTEEQAYTVLTRLVLGRGLGFDPSAINVIGMRGFHGEMHDNGEPQGRVFRRDNRYDDTVYLVTNRDGARVQRARGTVDPGNARPGKDPVRFQVAARAPSRRLARDRPRSAWRGSDDVRRAKR